MSRAELHLSTRVQLRNHRRSTVHNKCCQVTQIETQNRFFCENLKIFSTSRLNLPFQGGPNGITLTLRQCHANEATVDSINRFDKAKDKKAKEQEAAASAGRRKISGQDCIGKFRAIFLKLLLWDRKNDGLTPPRMIDKREGSKSLEFH